MSVPKLTKVNPSASRAARAVGIGGDGAIGDTALLTGRDHLIDRRRKLWIVAPQAGRQAKRDMQVEGADEDQIDAGDSRDRVDIGDRRLSLDLQRNQDFMVGVFNVLDVAGGAKAEMRDQAARPAITERRIAGEAHRVGGFLRRVDHGDNDPVRAQIERVLDAHHRPISHADERRAASAAHIGNGRQRHGSG